MTLHTKLARQANRRAFTLMEMLIVVAIIVILAGVGTFYILPQFTNVKIGWMVYQAPVSPTTFDLWIDDEGSGLTNASNLFVPFFTTKPGGSGIGLVLSRQIAEAHGGSLTLENRVDRRGCRAFLRLPL